VEVIFCYSVQNSWLSSVGVAGFPSFDVMNPTIMPMRALQSAVKNTHKYTRIPKNIQNKENQKNKNE
jgi:hypothetical protein